MPRKPKEDWHYCHKCQLKRGAKIPEGDVRCVTMMEGFCTLCLQHGKTLVPNDDYDWPDGRKSKWE